jgi:arsenical-resistance protein
MAPGVAARPASSPASSEALDRVSVGTTNLPIAIGLILMMYPPLAKVRYEKLPEVFRDWKILALSLVQNWVVGPVLMFTLAVLFLRDQPEYMVGLIMVGLARCIAMVLVWNDLARGSSDYAPASSRSTASSRCSSSDPTRGSSSPTCRPSWGSRARSWMSASAQVFQSVMIYLGIPFFAGMLTRLVLRAAQGRRWYTRVFLPRIARSRSWRCCSRSSSCSACKGDRIVAVPLDILRIALPLTIYFVVMFFVSFLLARAGRRGLRAGRDARLHRHGQQLRARHRRRHRGLRHRLGRGLRHRRRPAGRGPRAHRARQRLALARAKAVREHHGPSAGAPLGRLNAHGVGMSRKEWTTLAGLIALFLGIYLLPIGVGTGRARGRGGAAADPVVRPRACHPVPAARVPHRRRDRRVRGQGRGS